MKRCFFRILAFFISCVPLWCNQPCLGIDININGLAITVPNQLRLRQGNTNSPLPLLDEFGGSGAIHYQQVFAATEFAALPPGGSYLRVIALRSDCTQTLGFYSTTNLNIWFSTTQRQPDHMSAIFAENVGADVTLMRRRSELFGLGDIGCPNPGSEFPYGVPIFFDGVPFHYDPSKGNLLMEIEVRAIQKPSKRFIMEAENVVGDGISRAVGRGFASEKADIALDSTGIPVYFAFVGPPILAFQREKAGVTVGWYDFPAGFNLQWSDTLGSSAQWKNYAVPTQADRDVKTVLIPAAQLGKANYFRLIHPTLPSLGNPPPPVSSQPNP